MTFESENYSPLERVDEKLRRRILDERYPDAENENRGTVTAGAMRGYGKTHTAGCGCMNKVQPKRTSGCGCMNKVQPTRTSGCGCMNEVQPIRTVRRTDCCSRTSQCRTEEDICTAGCSKNGPSLAMVYSPHQYWRCIQNVSTGLRHGTIFRELDLPFYPTPCRKGGTCCDK